MAIFLESTARMRAARSTSTRTQLTWLLCSCPWAKLTTRNACTSSSRASRYKDGQKIEAKQPLFVAREGHNIA